MDLLSRKKPIKVRLSGGLGNQLFQVSNALNVSIINQSEIVLDLSWYKFNYMKSDLVQNRKFELDYFPMIRDISKITSNNPSIDRKVGSLQRRMSGKNQKILGVMTEKNFAEFAGQPKIIDGVFASKNYLPEKEELSKFFNFPLDSSSWFNSQNKVLRLNHSIAVHVRMGDYLNLKEIYDVIGLNYYVSAINKIKSDQPNAKFYLFSDSPEVALNWLSPAIRFDGVISSPDNIQVGETLRLMASCRGLICANSTFSWWAGYMGTNFLQMHKVIIPKKFTNFEKHTVHHNYLLNGWEMI
jgi:hypothetical protein